MAAVFGRVRSPATIVTLLAEEGKEVSLASPEDACDIGQPLAKAICLNSIDGVEMGSVQWVTRGIKAVGPRVRAAREKVPKVDIAGLLRKRLAEDASLDEVDACDTSADTLERARCMGSYDPLSSTSAGWVWRSAQAAKTARSKLPKVKLGGLWGRKALDLHDEVDACDTSDDTLSRALCIDDHDPFSNGKANWVLNRLQNAEDGWIGTTKNPSPESASAGTRAWNIWRTPLKSSLSADIRDI
jgi:hypothetical protein